MTGKSAKSTNKSKRKRKDKRPAVEPYSTEDVIYQDVKALLGEEVVLKAQEDGSDVKAPVECQQELELVVSALSSNGECILPYLLIKPTQRDCAFARHQGRYYH